MLVTSQLTVLCTEETNEVQVVSEEALQRDSPGLPHEPGQEQAVEEDRRAGGKGVGEVGRTPQVPATLLESQENQEMEGPARDQLVIPDGQEEEQDADKEGE